MVRVRIPLYGPSSSYLVTTHRSDANLGCPAGTPVCLHTTGVAVLVPRKAGIFLDHKGRQGHKESGTDQADDAVFEVD
jgi:hypothetical protein